MKKITLLSAAAMVAVAAQAQFNVEPATSVVAAQNPSTVDYLVLSDAAIADFEKVGAKMNSVAPDEDTRHLWVWELTFIDGDSSMPRVDMEEGDYVSLIVSNIGWSGAGFNIDGAGVDLSHFDMDTRLHVAYMSPNNNAPASVAFIVMNGDATGTPAKFAVGTAFNDNGDICPSVGAKMTDEWQAIDLSFADMKKLYPKFDLNNLNAWTGNILSFLAGGVQGQGIGLDAIYFYNTKAQSSVEGVEADAAFIVTANTINVAGGNGIELYNLAGVCVKSTNGTTLGLNGLATGVYVAKSGNIVRKVVVK